MGNKRNLDWNISEQANTADWVSVAVLMDIRDELKKLNAILHCQNFLTLPVKLRTISKTVTAIKNNTQRRRKTGN